MVKKRWMHYGLSVLLVVLMGALLAGTGFAAQDKAVKIGIFEPLSGVSKYLGDLKVCGAKFHAARWNEKYGGLLGHKIEVLGYDDQFKPDVAVKMATKAILEDGVNLIWHGTGSHIAKVLAKTARKHNVIYLIGDAEAESLTGAEADAYHFRVGLSTAMHAKAIASYYKDKPNIKKFAVICQDYNFGHEAGEAFKRAIKKDRPDAEIAAEIYHPLMTKDFAPYITKLNAGNAQVIFTANWGSDLKLLLKQGKEFGLKGQIAGFFLEDITMLKDIQDAAVGHVWADKHSMFHPSGKQNAYNQEWHKRYKEFCGENIDSAWQYPPTTIQIASNLDMFFTAVQKVGAWDVPKIIKTLEGMEFEGFYGKVIMRAEDHQLLQPIPVMQFVKENSLYHNEFPGAKLLRTIPLEETTIPLGETGCTRKAGTF
jgi:branched-chain amino acid transport system substrate-binding protein